MENLNDDLKSNENILKGDTTLFLKDSYRPNMTIQDSYLMFYFGTFHMPNSPNAPNINPSLLQKENNMKLIGNNSSNENNNRSNVNIIIKKPERATQKIISSSKIEENYIVEKYDNKLSGKKVKRHSDSLDPLEIFNIRDKRGNFIKDEKNILLIEDNEELNNIQNQIQYFEYSNLLGQKKLESRSNQEEIKKNTIDKKKEEDLLIPSHLRHKKNK